eukprot:gene38830-51044_t
MALDGANIIYLALAVGIISGFLMFMAYFYCCRNKNPTFEYQSVQHELDEEEIAFKRTIEMQSDDLDELFSFSGNDMDFDPQDRDRLRMLDKYRSNLVA